MGTDMSVCFVLEGMLNISSLSPSRWAVASVVKAFFQVPERSGSVCRTSVVWINDPVTVHFTGVGTTFAIGGTDMRVAYPRCRFGCNTNVADLPERDLLTSAGRLRPKSIQPRGF